MSRAASPAASTRRRLALVVAMLVAVAACGGNDLDGARRSNESSSATTAPSADEPTTTAPDTLPPVDAASGFPADWTPEKLRWESCEDEPDAECASLAVPLDWSKPAGTTIDLALARFTATGSRMGSLVTNPGGPGASGRSFLFARPFGDELAQRFDLVSWDPRGVGASAGLSCGDGTVEDFLANDPDPDDAAEQAALDAAAAAVSAECATTDAEMLPFVGTDDTARDLEAIRMALGEPRLTYMGFSYGTLIGERYLALFGERVRAMVLDGVVDPTEGLVGLLTGQNESLTATFERALESCGTAKKCPMADPSSTYDSLRTEVETDPLPARQDIGPAELATAAIYSTYDPRLWPDMLDAIASGASGDGSDLWTLASGYYDIGDWTAYAAITCLDSPHPQGAAAYQQFVAGLKASSARFGGSVGNEMLPCATWPTPVKDITGPVTAPDAPPVLVVGNTGDAATPYDDAVDVAEMLATGHLLTYEGEGHTSYRRDACVDRFIHRYLIDLEVPPENARCGGSSSAA